MNEATAQPSGKAKFSLGNLLILISLIAVGTAVALGYRDHRALLQHREQLLALSSRLEVRDEKKLASVELPRFANDFHSWKVHVPTGQIYELRLGLGEISENGIPEIVGRVPLPAGQHRVTMHLEDSSNDLFSYGVFVDGKQVLDQEMGSGWMPGGWSSASSVNWPQLPSLTTAHQLASRSYQARSDFGRGNYFNGQSDDYVTRKGYRLWIDQADQTVPPASPFIGFSYDQPYHGIGLRDGLRYRPGGQVPFEWTFTRPSLDTKVPILRVSPEFIYSDGTVLSGAAQKIQSWQLRAKPQGKESLDWQLNPHQTAYVAYLHANLNAVGATGPVVELKWEIDRPNQVAVRLADTPVNDQVARWRIRILGGKEHLWRSLHIGERHFQPQQISSQAVDVKTDMAEVELDVDQASDVQLQWQTNETLPLQVVQRNQTLYAGLELYQGLPATFAMSVSAALQPRISVGLVEQMPDSTTQQFPGGAVFEQIQVELDSRHREWIWLKAMPMQ